MEDEKITFFNDIHTELVKKGIKNITENSYKNSKIYIIDHKIKGYFLEINDWGPLSKRVQYNVKLYWCGYKTLKLELIDNYMSTLDIVINEILKYYNMKEKELIDLKSITYINDKNKKLKDLENMKNLLISKEKDIENIKNNIIKLEKELFNIQY